MNRRRSKLGLEALESRDCPATLDVSGGDLTYTGDSGNNNVTVSISSGSYGVNDSAFNITLTANAITAGWNGNGTKTVTGPTNTVTGSMTFDLGGGSDTFNLRDTNNAVIVNGGAGTNTVNVSGNAPSNTASLATIDANVTVNGTGGTTNLNVSDQGATTGNADVRVTASQILGLAGPADEHAIDYVNVRSLRLVGSNVSTLSEVFTIAQTPPVVNFRLDCGNGDDAVFVNADVAGNFYLGTGNDALTVLAGVTLAGSVHTGGQAGDAVFYGPPAFGTITGSVGA